MDNVKISKIEQAEVVSFKSETKRNYPALRGYLNLQLVDVNYLTHSKKSSFWFFVLALPFLIIFNLRALWPVIYTEFSTFSYYFGDIAMVAGELVRRQIALADVIWTFGCTLSVILLYYSQHNPKFQHWHKNIGKVFEHYSTSNRKLYLGLNANFLKWFSRFNLLVFYFSGALACIVSLPTLFIYPKEYMIYALMWLPFTWVAGVFCSFYIVNFAFLFFLYVYISGLQVNYLYHKFAPILNLKESASNTILKPPQSSIESEIDNELINNSVSILQHRLLLRLKKIIASNEFWTIQNLITFLVTFFVQTIMIYVTLYVPVPKPLTFGLVVYSILNFFCGQSLHFILGAYGQRKIVRNYNLFKHPLYLEIPINTKIKSIIFLEYVEQRYFFTILDSLNYSTKNLILTFLEGTTNLLLLIVSMNGSSK